MTEFDSIMKRKSCAVMNSYCWNQESYYHSSGKVTEKTRFPPLTSQTLFSRLAENVQYS